MDDKDIVALFESRNEKAITATAAKYGRLCHNVAMRIVGDRQDAEECVNDTYLGLWQAIPPKKPKSLSAFAARITRNLAISRLKYNKADKRSAGALLSLEELEDIIPDTADFEALSDGEVARLIGEFLRGEREEVRNIFIRKYWYFDTVTELSLKFGQSETGIKSILFRTRQRLRAYLGKEGVAV